MKKLLIGSSALVALGALPAVAMAEAPELSMSGAVDVAVSTGSDTNGDASGVGLGQGNSSTALIFDWAGSHDNGLAYGARLDYRFQNTDVDEQYIFLSGSWGRLVIGGDDGVIDNNVPGGESVMAGDGGFDGNNQINNPVGAANVAPTLDTGTDDNMKFSYYSPSFSGFSAGASYIPDVANDPGNATGNGSGVDENGFNIARGDSPQFEGTLAYNGSFDAVGISAGIGYAYQEGGDGFEDATGLMAGATVSFAGFSAGVGYADNGDTGCAQNANCEAGDWINFGLAYSFGPGSVSLGYALAEQDPDGNGDDEAVAYHIDADYAVAEGLRAYAGFNVNTSKDASANQEDGSYQALLGMTVSF